MKMSKLKFLFHPIIEFIYYFLPIKQKTVLFSSFSGQYNDNPKYISEKLHEMAPDINIVWLHSSKGKDSLPSYVNVVKNNTLKLLYYIYTSKVLIDNHLGMRSIIRPQKKWISNIYFRLRSTKKRGQLSISTWHGTPLKKIALDEPRAQSLHFYNNCDFILSGCGYTSDCIMSAFRNIIPIKEYGTPRNDILLNEDIDILSLKMKLGLPIGKKILLYAPTFRKDIEMSGVHQICNDINFEELFVSLNKKFGGEWCFAYRVHNLVTQALEKININNERIINANLHDDMAEYLKCVDFLITDYSSSFFDFILTNKKCILYTPDLEEYENAERGFYMQIKNLPFPIAKTYNELIDAIRFFDEEKYKSDINIFMKRIRNKEDGKASERVAAHILSYLEDS